jgi:Rrf2 family protein
MRLTRAGEYAIRCVLHLATQEPGKVVSRRQVAAAMDIPEPFLGKIARQLTLKGILDVVQGAQGGYRLASSPKDVSLLDVVEAVMGSLALNDCVARPGSCSRNPDCPIYPVWKKATEQLCNTLRAATMEKLTGNNGNGNGRKK